ncbi:MAG: hypothetical protein ACKO96_34695, partial [Flammeovirgaceae bacterium]
LERLSQHRRMIGQPPWHYLFRPDIAFTIKELAMYLNGPTEYSFRRLKHLLRYIKAGQIINSK